MNCSQYLLLDLFSSFKVNNPSHSLPLFLCVHEGMCNTVALGKDFHFQFSHTRSFSPPNTNRPLSLSLFSRLYVQRMRSTVALRKEKVDEKLKRLRNVGGEAVTDGITGPEPSQLDVSD